MSIKLTDSRAVLLHYDFKLDNVLLDPQSLRPSAVLDWDQGTRGDGLFDLAVLLSYWSEPSDPPAMRDMGQMPANQPGLQSRKDAAERYAAASNRDLSHFQFYRVLANFAPRSYSSNCMLAGVAERHAMRDMQSSESWAKSCFK